MILAMFGPLLEVHQNGLFSRGNEYIWLRIFIQSKFKGSMFLKNAFFIIQERFNKLIYGIFTILKCGTWQPVKFRLVSLSSNEMIFFIVSELILATFNSEIW